MSVSRDDGPTFGTYWRKNKEDSADKSLTFVQSDPSRPGSRGSEKKTAESEQSAKNKRRAQVRKAQIQHRARKANYTRQLEADVASITAQIEGAEAARRALRRENEAMRERLAASEPLPPPLPQQQHVTSAAVGFYETALSIPPTAFAPTVFPPLLEEAMSYQPQQVYGFDGAAYGLEGDASGGYHDVLDVDLSELLAATPGPYYLDRDGGSPAYTSGGSSGGGGVYASPQQYHVASSGRNTPYAAAASYLPDPGLSDVAHQQLEATGFRAGYS